MLILRPYTPDDWTALSMHLYPGMSETEIIHLISEWNTGIYNDHPFQMLAIENDGTLVGYVSLLEQDRGVASEGIEIYPPYRKQGYAFRALPLLFAHAQKEGYQTITAQIRKDNEASLALHRKLGFQILDEFVNKRGNAVFSLEKTLQ